MTKVQRALILGGLAGQVDAIRALQARGIETHACGHERSGPGVEAADGFHLADITDPEAVLRLARELDVDLVYSVGSDIAMPTVVEVSEQLGLPHFHGADLTRVLRRKEVLRDTLAKAGTSPVQYVYVGGAAADDSHAAAADSDGTADWNLFPCIVKPVDAQGQRGISVVHNAADLGTAIAAARASSTSNDAIIEEYLVGPEVSAHVIVEDGEAVLVIPSDRHVWEGPLTGIPEAHSMPLRPETASATGEINALVRAAVAALGVHDGPLYFQMMLTDNGPRIIEIASRLDGCHLWRMVREATGYDLLDDVLGRLCGDEWQAARQTELQVATQETPHTPPQAPSQLEVRPTSLRFFLDSPDMQADSAYRASHQTPGAAYVEWQLEPGDLPRRTNPIVARLGYEIVEGTP
ncbi:ATP-grasp domain-containing protein [Leucobacter sp. GX24907]